MGVDSALALIDSVAESSALFIGDYIRDEYRYVKSLNKASKEPIVATQYVWHEDFQGGVMAAAAHAKTFCWLVSVQTGPNGVAKVRYVDEPYYRKVFEVHYALKDLTHNVYQVETFDTVVVTDFGHGCMDRTTIAEVAKKAKFLAVNAQTNSANLGYNLITKYHHADYIVIDEPEARLAAADRDGHIEDVILKLSYGRCSKFVVTLGVKGAIGYDGAFHRAEARTDRVVDTMGAGDAFFAVTAPMAKHGSMEDLLTIGNAAGALKTQIVGHRASVTKAALKEYLRESA